MPWEFKSRLAASSPVIPVMLRTFEYLANVLFTIDDAAKDSKVPITSNIMVGSKNPIPYL
jgi:hypothetical protein